MRAPATTASLGRWHATWRMLGVEPSPAVDRVHADLVARYAEPHRHYHTMRHIDECLRQVDLLRSYAVHAVEVDVALWFHDAIYDTRRSDSEARSAKLATRAARSLGVQAASAETIAALIVATAHGEPPHAVDADVVVDVDLSILGAPARRFDEYERDVRREYAWVPEARFRAARSTLLTRLLARPRLFATPLFHARYERRARANLARSLAALPGAA
jgi:predicted metal-dependent HD superfamily phosphohydrolase